MKKRKALLVLKISATLALLLFLPVSVVLAGNPNNPPEQGERLMGPAVMGEFIFTDSTTLDEDPMTHIFFDGSCKGFNYTADTDIQFDYYQINEEYISLFRITTFVLPTGCGPESYSGLLVHKVLEFDDSESTIKRAKVIMLFVVPK